MPKLKVNQIKYLLQNLQKTKSGRQIISETLNAGRILRIVEGSITVVTAVECSPQGVLQICTRDISYDGCGRITDITDESCEDLGCCGSGVPFMPPMFQYSSNPLFGDSLNVLNLLPKQDSVIYPKNDKLQFVRSSDSLIGKNYHRGGWPFAMDQVFKTVSSNKDLLFDDFIEQTFAYSTEGIHSPLKTPYTKPWVGIFHHPPNMPYFINREEKVDVYMHTEAMKASLPHLKVAICLSDYLAKHLTEQYGIKTAVIKHPNVIPDQLWSKEKYLNQKNKKLIQVGWYLRNTRAIDQTPDIPYHLKVKLLPQLSWVKKHDTKVRRYWNRLGTRKEYGKVNSIPYMSNQIYDNLLASNLVMSEIFDASANNVTIDCIARNTPLFINRNPAVVEYLGEDYPLYFETPEQISQLMDKVLEAHEYLKCLDKSWLSNVQFAKRIQEIINNIKL